MSSPDPHRPPTICICSLGNGTHTGPCLAVQSLQSHVYELNVRLSRLEGRTDRIKPRTSRGARR